VSTGQGNDRLHLLGFSYGVWIAYAIAAQETQLSPGRRNVKGIIPVDSYLKPDNETERLADCDGVVQNQAAIDAGVYQWDIGLFFEQVGNLAASAPNEVSPFSPPLTNWQFALAAGAGFVGVIFDSSGIPTGLRYTDPRLWIDVARAVPPYSAPNQAFRDWLAVGCNEEDVPFFDHFSEATLPILYIGSAGGAREAGYYNATLTASRDVSKLVVAFLPPDQWMSDFGHADLFTARSAERLVWRPILHWLLAHRSDRTDFAEAKR
jgi:hypothetical protein